MIPKEKLKVGSLYKTKNTANDVVVYRVWLGKGWSIGSTKPRPKEYTLYNHYWAAYEKAEPVNTKASSFMASTNSFWDIDYPDQPIHKSAFVKPPSKPIRYLNRPE